MLGNVPSPCHNFLRFAFILNFLNLATQHNHSQHSLDDRVMAQNIPCSFISFFLHQDIFHYFGSFLVDSGRFHLNSTISTAFLLVELVVINHGHHVGSFMLVPATLRSMLFLFLAHPEGLRYASNII